MDICMHASHPTILCILFIVISWADVNAQSRSYTDGSVSRRRREDTIGSDAVKEALEQFRNTLEEIKQNCAKLENTLINHRNSLEKLEDDMWEIRAAVTKQDKNTRALEEKTSSILNFQKQFEDAVDGFRSELAGVKRELLEDRNALDQKFMAPLEILNQTVQLLAHKPYEDLSRQVAELKAEQQQEVSVALHRALQEVSRLRETHISEIAELKADQQKQAAAAFEIFEHSENMKKALEELSQFRENYASQVAEVKAEQQKQVSAALHRAQQLWQTHTSQIAELKAEQQKQAAAAFEMFEHSENMKKAMQELSQFRAETDVREKRAISNKCSLNVRHKPEDGRIDVLMVMDPPNVDPAACN